MAGEERQRTREETEQGIYIRLLLGEKAKQLGIHVGEDALVAAARIFCARSAATASRSRWTSLRNRCWRRKDWAWRILQNFLRDELVVQQMIQVLGLSGALVTPQEAGQLYDREHQEVSAQAVFFSASNYLAQVAATPAAVGQFYTNYMAAYREPDRVQVSYVFFNVTNYLAAAEQKSAGPIWMTRSNRFTANTGWKPFPDAKTPGEAKAKIREFFIRQERAGRRAASRRMNSPRRCSPSIRPGRKISPPTPNKKAWPRPSPRRSRPITARKNSPRRRPSPRRRSS